VRSRGAVLASFDGEVTLRSRGVVTGRGEDEALDREERRKTNA